MNFNEFTNELREVVSEQLGNNYEVKLTTVMKNNSTEFTGLLILHEDNNVSPTIYLEEFYDQYQSGKELDQLSEDVIGLYDEAIQHVSKNLHADFKLDFEQCEDKIIYRLVSMERNQHLLKSIPYVKFLDMAVIFCLVYNKSEQGIETIRITNQLQKEWGVNTYHILELANKNTRKLFPPKISSLSAIISSYMSEDEVEALTRLDPKYDLSVVTNESGINGATVLLYKDYIRKVAYHFQSDLYILPSSIHEILVLPINSGVDVDSLRETVNYVNNTAVSNEEYLSDNVYTYSYEENAYHFE